MLPTAKRGPTRLPRRRINPQLLHTIYGTGKPIWRLAYECGFTYPAAFSALLHMEEIPDSQGNRKNLERIADVVGFDRSQLFLDAGR